MLLGALAMCFAGMPAGAADVTVIDTSGTTPFLYGGSTYIPLTSAARFLGAQLQWDAAQNRAVVTYNGKNLALTPGSRNASFDGRPVVLAMEPVVINGRTYTSTEPFKRFYNVPMEWDRSKSEVRMQGPGGWGRLTVSRQVPPGWYHGRKTGWRKHGNANMPPGLSRKHDSQPRVVAPKAKGNSQKTGKNKGDDR
jgi:hypothetical protein